MVGSDVELVLEERTEEAVIKLMLWFTFQDVFTPAAKTNSAARFISLRLNRRGRIRFSGCHLSGPGQVALTYITTKGAALYVIATERQKGRNVGESSERRAGSGPGCSGRLSREKQEGEREPSALKPHSLTDT